MATAIGRPSRPAAPLGRLPPGRGWMSGGSRHEGPIHSLLGASGPSSSGSRSRSSEPPPPSPSPTPFPAHEGPTGRASAGGRGGGARVGVRKEGPPGLALAGAPSPCRRRRLGEEREGRYFFYFHGKKRQVKDLRNRTLASVSWPRDRARAWEMRHCRRRKEGRHRRIWMSKI